MLYRRLVLLSLLPLLLCAQDSTTSVAPAASEDGVSVFFSPQGGAAAAIVKALDSARSSVDIQAYYFTSSTIAKAVVEAHKRGVKVRVVIDHNVLDQQRYSVATYLTNSGVPVWIDGEHAIAHSKVVLIDGGIVITGSFNFTRAADEENVENLLVIENKPKLYKAFAENFDLHWSHAKPYKPRQK
jgi:phosphatidylserine/phosphatidylglycerophosphate/cardiolipin synthase-like enzyme